VAATISEYLIYTFTSAALAIAGLTYLLGNFPLAQPIAAGARVLVWVMGAFLAVAAWAIVWRVYLIGAILRGVKTFPWIRSHLALKDQDIRETEDLLFVVLRGRPLRFLSIAAIEAIAQVLLILELFTLLRATTGSVSFLKAFAIEGATKFIGLAFFFIPGQVGAAEGIYALIFKAVGLTAPAGFALAVARRLRSMLVAGLGLILGSP